ncbi:zf-HC2 domain-containing protein [Embleya sp. NBC_00896]|uniref:zf-HC2 domain-containing protein n=1 Tax=Embleya sp. NBC_00896 TaxID=2975961 RepID=UPI002F912C9C|nr:zf-HC2 domain-containing protein [Embleya sp. NBC_00896]
MECTRYRDALSAWLDGEATGAPVVAAHAHVGGCAACAAWLADARTLRALVERAPEPDPGHVDDVLRMLRGRPLGEAGPGSADGA